MKADKNNKNRRIIGLILTIVMIFTTACGSNDAEGAGNSQSNIESATANIMRLELFEGEIYIENSDGQALEPFEGMRLQSGYSVKTGTDGFAFISLDDSKAIKLDKSSASTIDYNGKDLLLTLTAGSLFFNVTAPLADDESMNIQTSNMITGIRGTSGIVSTYTADSRTVSETTILTGKVLVNATDSGDDDDDNNDNDYDDVDLPAGKTAFYDYEDDIDRITIVDLSEDNLSDFALKALEGEEELLEEIEANGDLNSEELRRLIDELNDDDDDEDDDDDDDNEENDDDDNEENDDEDEDEDDDDDEKSSSGSADQNSNNSSSDSEEDDDDEDDKSESQSSSDDDDDDESESQSSSADGNGSGGHQTPAGPSTNQSQASASESDDDDDD